MKDLTWSVICVLVLAVALGLTFHWLYPHVDLTAELYGLFVFVAVILERVLSKLWSMLHKPRTQPDAGAHK